MAAAAFSSFFFLLFLEGSYGCYSLQDKDYLTRAGKLKISEMSNSLFKNADVDRSNRNLRDLQDKFEACFNPCHLHLFIFMLYF